MSPNFCEQPGAAMKFALSGLPNYPGNSSIYPVKGMDHTKVYPFTFSLPPYASWREYTQTLLNQLKSCPNCRAAADEFPISLLPKVHKLPNGKTLIFKGLASASEQWRNSAEDCHSETRAFTPQANSLVEPIPTLRHQLRQSLSTIDEVVEEYDMVSIDPNCPRHGKYSRMAWLRKQKKKSAGVKVGPGQQIIPKAKESKNRSRLGIGKCESKADGTGRSISSEFWRPLDRFYLHMLDKDVVEKRSRVTVSAPRRRKGENVEPNELKQIAVPGANVTSVLSQKQHNILSMHNQKPEDLVAGRQSHRTKSADSRLAMTELSREENCICEDGSLECNAYQMRVKNKSTEMEVKCRTPLPTLVGEKEYLPVSDLVNKVDSVSSPTCRCLEMAQTDKLRSPDSACNVPVTSASSVEMVAPTRREKNVSNTPRCTAPVQECSNNRQKRELSRDFDRSIPKCRETYASQYTRMCLLKGLNRNCCSIYDEAVDSTESQDHNKLLLNRVHQVPDMDMNMDSKVPLSARECVQQETDHITDETTIKFVGDKHPTKSMKEHPQAASDVFNLKELELARQRLEKIGYTAKTLQLGLKDHPSREEMPIANLHLTQTQTIIDRNEARDWLPHKANPLTLQTNTNPKNVETVKQCH